MNKARVEAFTDAVVAIIMTIMVLEFKTPESPQWTAILHEGPYLFAFGVSFVFIAVAWYNHHYMFSLAERISKRVYWLNIAWLFAMSLLPVATAWAGRYLQARGPEYFYLLVFFLWSKTYLYQRSHRQRLGCHEYRESRPAAADADILLSARLAAAGRDGRGGRHCLLLSAQLSAHHAVGTSLYGDPHDTG